MRLMDFYSDTWIVLNEKLKEKQAYLLGQLQDPSKTETETAVLRGRLIQISETLRLPYEQSADVSKLADNYGN